MARGVIEPVTQRRTTAAVDALLRRVECEYSEMPGLCLTAAQAERLFGLSGTTCAIVLATLVEAGRLKLTARGTYIRS